jgi:hypothetical protein
VGAVSAGARAAEALLEEKEALARAVTAALYAERPELLQKHGERGRDKCLQDMRYNVEHLAPAVGMDEPPLFAGYATWLDGLLRARGVDTADLTRSLALLEAETERRLSADGQAVVRRCIRAGLAALGAA